MSATDPTGLNGAMPGAGEIMQLSSGHVAVSFRESMKARFYAIRVRTDGTVLVTIPRRGSLKAARRFLDSRRAWVERSVRTVRNRVTVPKVWEAGLEILFRGNRIPIRVESPDGIPLVFLGNECCGTAPTEGGLRGVVERHLRRIAIQEFPLRIESLARQHACPLRRVTIRDQRTRWGSCSRRGGISLNWRLIQLPEAVAEYVLLHELMHLREMNHSPRFWSHVEQVCPAYREHKRWLKTHGPALCL
jgi:hypothetical protein